MEVKWIEKIKKNEEFVPQLSSALNIDPFLAQILCNRNITSFDKAKKFFRPSLDDLHDPFLMMDMEKAVKRLDEALENEEKILIFGDYDVDGTTATALMFQFVSQFTSKIEYYIPNRFKEGYGISEASIEYANTNNFGVFYFNLDNEYKNSKATIEVINNIGENFELELNLQRTLDYGKLKFNNFWITENEKNLILESSIFNQIENAYSSLRPDAIIEPEPITPFYGSNIKEYILDDYTRFSTISETIVEVVNLVYIKQKKGIKTAHVIRPSNTYKFNNNLDKDKPFFKNCLIISSPPP